MRQPSRRLAGPVTENRCAVGIYASEHLLEWARGLSKAATKAKVISWRSSLAQGGFVALPVGVSAEGIPEADRQALCSPSSAATESSGAVE